MTVAQPKTLTGQQFELKRGFAHDWDEYPVIVSDIMPGVLRQSVANDNLMLSRIEYLPGGGVPLHSHAAQQVIIMISGTMTLTVGEETSEITAGEFGFVPGWAPHALISKDGCVFLEAATPTRVEYLTGYIGPTAQVLNLNKEESKA